MAIRAPGYGAPGVSLATGAAPREGADPTLTGWGSGRRPHGTALHIPSHPRLLSCFEHDDAQDRRRLELLHRLAHLAAVRLHRHRHQDHGVDRIRDDVAVQ